MEAMPEKSHVRDIIKASKGLPLGARAVLAEVCAMCEHGNKGCFYANNRHLAEALGLTMPKVSAHLHTLAGAGFLVIDGSGNGSGKGRVITPSAALRKAYLSGVDSLTEMIRLYYKPYRNDKATLTETVIKPYRNGKHNSIEQEEEPNPLLQQLLAANAAVVALQEEVERLNARLKKAEEVYHQQREEIATLKAKSSKAQKLSAQFPELAFDVFWNSYDKKVGSKPNAQAKWERLNEATRRLILAGLETYKSSHREKQFQPYPESFLNGQLWLAETYGLPAEVGTGKAAPLDPETERLKAFSQLQQAEPVFVYKSGPNRPPQVQEAAAVYKPLAAII